MTTNAATTPTTQDLFKAARRLSKKANEAKFHGRLAEARKLNAQAAVFYLQAEAAQGI